MLYHKQKDIFMELKFSLHFPVSERLIRIYSLLKKSCFRKNLNLQYSFKNNRQVHLNKNNQIGLILPDGLMILDDI